MIDDDHKRFDPGEPLPQGDQVVGKPPAPPPPSPTPSPTPTPS